MSDQKLSKSRRYQNAISGSIVMAILLKGWILPVGGVASGRVCACACQLPISSGLGLIVFGEYFD